MTNPDIYREYGYDDRDDDSCCYHGFLIILNYLDYLVFHVMIR